MSDKMLNKKNLVFGLDIGTRSIVGSVGYLEGENSFRVVAHHSKEHETRSMLDGQIHDINKVSDTISKVKNELEKQLDTTLKDVCIAAAGRVLKTETVHIDYEMNEETVVTPDIIYSLEMMGVEKAYEEIRASEKNINFYCVGYTVIRYFQNDYAITNLEGHKARKISADVLATFLPDEVVDGLYSAVEKADLSVANLTLEPIAAINIAIPEKYRLLNIALVDVGAGTSDISITKEGSIIAYGMIPRAGDELTESLVSKYLVDFNTAEKIKRGSTGKKQISFKDIMGLKQKVTAEEARDVLMPVVESITKSVADKIIELNGGKTVSAVFVVGGGGKVFGFTKKLSEYLEIPEERVALRGEEVLTSIHFEDETVKKDPLLVTPIGICLSYYDHKNNFIFVNVNDNRIKLYDNDKLTIVDAALAIGIPNDGFFPKRGEALEFYLNGEKRMVRGNVGEAAVIKLNGENANINTKINKNDVITITESTAGKPARLKLEELKEYSEKVTFIVNGQKVICPKFVSVNGKLQSMGYEICNGDEIIVNNYYTLDEFAEYFDINRQDYFITVNHKVVEENEEPQIYDNFQVDFEMTVKTEPEIFEKPDSSELPKDAADSQNGVNIAGDKNATVESSNTINIIVNGRQVELANKESYIFVDILDFYPFDTKTPKGNDLKMTINGEKCEFTSEIKDGDVVELCWVNMFE